MRGFYRKGGYYGKYNRKSRMLKELKFLDDKPAISSLVVPYTGVSANICLVKQGTGESQRIGRKIVARSIFFRGFIELKETTVLIDIPL